MHNVRLASPMNPYAKRLSALTKAKTSSKRTDQDRIDIAKVEFEGGLYWNEEVGPYVPAKWFSKNLLDAARRGRRGKLVEEGVLVGEGSLINPLVYRGPRDIESLWGDGESEFVSFETVRVGMAKVDRCRPIFNDWAAEVDFEIEEDVIDFDTFRDIAVIGGRLGLGDYRSGGNGRFNATVTAL
jgi:hypothetical protein